jgi:P2 family phage contractile tail tube protein
MMVNRKSEAFNNASIFIEGLGFISSAAKGKLPDVEFVQYTNTSGMAEHTVDTSVLKQMKATLELIEENRVYAQALSRRKNEKTVIWIKYESNAKKIVVTLMGNITKLGGVDVETGKENKQTMEISVSFYKKEVDGDTELLIDVDNLICELGGVDIWADSRAFIFG